MEVHHPYPPIDRPVDSLHNLKISNIDQVDQASLLGPMHSILRLVPLVVSREMNEGGSLNLELVN